MRRFHAERHEQHGSFIGERAAHPMGDHVLAWFEPPQMAAGTDPRKIRNTAQADGVATVQRAHIPDDNVAFLTVHDEGAAVALEMSSELDLESAAIALAILQ